MKQKSPKKIPLFKTAEQEAEFWDTHSAADYALFPADADEILAELKARHQQKRNVTFRLEPELMKRLRERAQRMGVRYQTFVREWLWRAVA